MSEYPRDYCRECDPTISPALEAHLLKGQLLLSVHCGEGKSWNLIPASCQMCDSGKFFTPSEPEFICSKMGKNYYLFHRDVVWGK